MDTHSEVVDLVFTTATETAPRFALRLCCVVVDANPLRALRAARHTDAMSVTLATGCRATPTMRAASVRRPVPSGSACAARISATVRPSRAPRSPIAPASNPTPRGRGVASPPAAFGTNPIADPDQESPWALEVRVANRVQDDPPGASPDPAPGVWAPAPAIAPAELRRTPLSPLITRRLRTSG